MPLSSVLGASSVIKPGVCTSTTRPSVPYEGQLIYETDTDRVAAWNGSAWVYTHSSGLVLISSTTIGSTVSSATISNCFSSSYDSYKITINGGGGSSANAIGIQLGSTTTGYYSVLGQNTYSAGTSNLTTTNNASSFTNIGAMSTTCLSLSVDVHNPNLATRTLVFGHYIMPTTTGNAGYYSGFQDSTTQFTGLTFNFGATATGGTICIYGYRN